MYWFWFFVFASQPQFLLLGYLDILGEDAKKAADDLLPIYGVVAIIAIIVLAIVGIVYLFSS